MDLDRAWALVHEKGRRGFPCRIEKIKERGQPAGGLVFSTT